MSDLPGEHGGSFLAARLRMGLSPSWAEMTAPLKLSCSFLRALLGKGFNSDCALGRPA